jgi:ribokinase
MSRGLLERIDLLVVNRIEAEMLSGDAVRDVAGAAAALTELGGRMKNVIVTLGGDGLVVRFGQNGGRTIAPKPVKAVSSHGAGDCFVGALAA